jgi:hypothetical protein
VGKTTGVPRGRHGFHFSRADKLVFSFLSRLQPSTENRRTEFFRSLLGMLSAVAKLLTSNVDQFSWTI